jgi:hypothetical protein
MRKKAIIILALILIIPCIAYSVTKHAQTIPLPTSKQIWNHEPPQSSVTGFDPALLMPVSFGPAVSGGDTLTVQIMFNEFGGDVDIFAGYSASANPGVVNIIQPDGKSTKAVKIPDIVKSFSTKNPPNGFVAWKSGVKGPINEQIYNLPVAQLPSGLYTAYLLVTPANDISKFYLWITTINIGQAPESTLCADDLIGSWTGQWDNNTFDTQGSISMQVFDFIPNQAVRVMVDVNGNVFGIPDLAPIWAVVPVYCAPITTDFIQIIGGGTNSYSIDKDGNISGSTTNIPFPVIDSVDVTGKIDSQSIVLNYTVNFTFNYLVQGTVSINKQES